MAEADWSIITNLTAEVVQILKKKKTLSALEHDVDQNIGPSYGAELSQTACQRGLI